MSKDIHPTKYSPRNIINAPAIKAAISARSIIRGDDKEIAKWLSNHFYRWAIGNFERVCPIRSLSDYTACTGNSADIPEWLEAKLNANEAVYYLDPQQPQLLEHERNLVEFLSRQLNTRLGPKLQRINCFSALAMREAEHERIVNRRQQGWFAATRSAVKQLLRVDNGNIIEFDATHEALRREMAYESWHMQHCVGQFDDRKKLTGGYGDYYARLLEQGKLRLFSLRDNNNIPHVTLSMGVNDGKLHIDQIKGKQNRYPVRKYAADVLTLLRYLSPQPERHADCEGMGIVYEQTPSCQGWKFITEVHDFDFLLSVLHNHFHLLAHFPAPPVALQWLLLHSAPEQLHYLQAIDPTVATAAEMLLPQYEWHPLFAGKNISNAPFEIEGLTLQTARYLPATGE